MFSKIPSKNIIIFLSSQAVTLFGTSLVQYAIAWHITLVTGSGLMTMFSVIAGFLPTFLISPFAGVMADKFNKKNIIIISDSLIALTSLIIAVLLLSGTNSIWYLIIASVIRALGSGIQGPAISSLIPLITPKEQLTRVNGINGTIQTLIMLLAPIVSGSLLAFASIGAIFFIDVITAIFANLMLLLLFKLPKQSIINTAGNVEASSHFQDFKLGLKYIAKHKFLKSFFIFNGAFFLFVSPAAFLTGLQVIRNFGGDVWNLTLIEIAFSIGMLIGGMLISTWGGFKSKLRTMAFASFLISILSLSLGFIPFFVLYLIVMVFFGMAIPLFSVPSTVLLQENVESKYMGRVFGVHGMIASAMMPLAMLVFGPLADVVNINYLMMFSGGILLMVTFFMVRHKELFQAEIK